MRLSDPIAEGERVMTVCNSCRYCEGYCAVFPAMERRLLFSESDLNYLANLCHNCAECYYACQYAPPHEFAVNVPQTLAEIRARSYRKYCWPPAFANAFRSNGTLMVWALAAIVSLSVVVAFLSGRLSPRAGADFYSVVSHEAMVLVFGAAGLGAFAVLALGLLRCWRESGQGLGVLARPGVLWTAAKEAFTLHYLDQDGVGCTYPGAGHSQARRRYHHLTFYGFLLCLASTTVAAVYHYTGSPAPYPFFSLPVLLGTAGGIGLLAGPLGLYTLKRRRDPAIGDSKQDAMDIAFMATLFLISLTGLLLLALRQTPAMALLLVVHLGTVLALFVTMPYGKFVHGFYRYAALLRNALERAEDGRRSAETSQ